MMLRCLSWSLPRPWLSPDSSLVGALQFLDSVTVFAVFTYPHLFLMISQFWQMLDAE
jgi:hypothetical protein